MLLSHESPTCIMKYITDFCDYNYYLDVFMLDKRYNDYFRKYPKCTYLDCSLYERTRRVVEDLDQGIYIALYRKLIKSMDTYMIIPDYNNSMDKNIESIENFKDVNSKKIITVHGKDKSEYINCLRYYLDNTEDEIIALSGGDSWMSDESRSDVISKIDLQGRKIHFFGLRSPSELEYIKEVKDKIYSLDTSLPVTCALENTFIGNIKQKPKTIIFDIFDDEICIEEPSLLIDNLKYIRELLK